MQYVCVCVCVCVSELMGQSKNLSNMRIEPLNDLNVTEKVFNIITGGGRQDSVVVVG